MDRLTFISKLIESLAWPSVALVLGLAFRRKLMEVIPLIRKFKAGPLEAEFELAAKQALANAEQARSPEVLTAPGHQQNMQDVHGGDTVAKILDARADPAKVILGAWASIDGELFRLGQQLGEFVDPLTSSNKVYEWMMTSHLLPTETKRLVGELRGLRNQVAHAEVAPTPDAAVDYVLAANRAIELISNYRKNLPTLSANHGSPT
jgi:hypothetical protein